MAASSQQSMGSRSKLFASLVDGLALRVFGQRLGAMVVLTWKTAVRFKVVWVLVILLLGAVIALPSIVKHDGTARGFTQILLTYTLAAITSLLGLTTLWLACGTLARDIEECQMQLLMTKPIPRWQIWLGRWLGIVTLNLVLIAISGTVVFQMLKYRSGQLSPSQQKILQQEVFVARASARPEVPDIQAKVEEVLAARLKDPNVAGMDRAFVRQEVAKQVKAANEAIPSGYSRSWRVVLDHGAKARLKDQPLYLRVKFFSPEYSGSEKTYLCRWVFGPANSNSRVRLENDLSPETPVEFPIPPNLVSDDDSLSIEFQNWNNLALLFPLEEGIEVLYREGGFGLNFGRGLAIIWFWLALLAALGLACSSRMSFPVASFVSFAILIVCFSGGTIKSVIDQGGIMNIDGETGMVRERTMINQLSVQAFSGLSRVIGLARDFSPVDSLSTGRSITWGQCGQAFGQVVVLLGGIFGAIGMMVLTRREIALPT